MVFLVPTCNRLPKSNRRGSIKQIHLRASHCSFYSQIETQDMPAFYNISHKLLRPTQFLEKLLETLEWFTLQK